MAKHKRTELILENAISVLADYHPMTVRQVYYRLVSRQIIDNDRSYTAVNSHMAGGVLELVKQLYR